MKLIVRKIPCKHLQPS